MRREAHPDQVVEGTTSANVVASESNCKCERCVSECEPRIDYRAFHAYSDESYFTDVFRQGCGESIQGVVVS